jgi:LuxR family maltose regulon positive regulatory protein
MVGSLFAVWGEVLCEWNDPDRAIDYVTKGVEQSERGRDVAALGWSYVCLVRVLFSRQDLAGAEDAIHKMEKIGRESDVPPWITNQMATWQARIWLAQDKLEAASQWVQERGLSIDGELPFLREIEYTVLARLLMAQGRLNETTRLLQRLLEAAEAGGRTTRAIEILMLQALALQTGGDIAQAMTTLERALTLAEPGGYIRIFVDEDPPMAELLISMNASREGGTLRVKEYIHKLLAAFGMQKDVHPSSLIPQPLVEPLSERELEVLQLLAEGLTNQEIGARLFLSLNTVKVHTRNIYGKLDVHNRTQAVAQARALGVLPSI